MTATLYNSQFYCHYEKFCEVIILLSNQIKLVATDMDGTFLRSVITYDEERFKKIFSHMQKIGCQFVVASGNQYYQLRDFFSDYHEKISFVAENGTFVKAHDKIIFTAEIPIEVVSNAIDVCAEYPEIEYVLNGVECAYAQRGCITQENFDLMSIYCHRMKWVDDLKSVNDKFLKFGIFVPAEKTDFYCEILHKNLGDKIHVTTSGHGSIDMILQGCNKAVGLKKLIDLWKISPDQCVAFGDGGNDLEMLKFCGLSYAVDNAPDNVKAAAKNICPSNDDDGVLVTLEKIFEI